MVQINAIKQEIERLSIENYVSLRKWFAEYDWKMWNKQIENDSKSGKLDFLKKEVLKEKNDEKLKDL